MTSALVAQEGSMDRATIAERSYSILGAVRSGRAAARLLRKQGASVFVSDRSPAEKMAEAAAALDEIDAHYEFGRHSDRVLEADVLVLSPGVPSQNQVVQKAMAKGMKVVSEIELASWFCDSPIIAITGTNGKTTTTTLIGRMFEDAKRPCVVGGNIGTAFSEIVQSIQPAETVILEVSSFQLDHIAQFRPRVSVILNVTPDHLDRYENSFERYIESKGRIFMNQREGDTIVYNYDDPVTRSLVETHAPTAATRLSFSAFEVQAEGAFVSDKVVYSSLAGVTKEIIPANEVSIRGAHNLYNAMAATLSSQVTGISLASIRSTLKNFKGVEHRLEFVRELDGIMFVNDSKATNVDSVRYALQSFSAPLIVLLGGRDKGNDYSLLTELVRAHVKAVVAIGESAPKVVDAMSRIVNVIPATSMEEAVRTARAHARTGDVVLLSPACASFDWFENYEHRGKVFKKAVMDLKSEGKATK